MDCNELLQTKKTLLLLLYPVLEMWIGSTSKFKSNSFLELIVRFIWGLFIFFLFVGRSICRKLKALMQ